MRWWGMHQEDVSKKEEPNIPSAIHRESQRASLNGKQVLDFLSQNLSAEFGKGYDISNLRKMRQFYRVFPIQDALRPELSWTHYRELMRVTTVINRNRVMKCDFSSSKHMSEMLSLIFKGKGPFDIDLDTLFTYFEFLLAVFCEKNVLFDAVISQNRQVTTIIQNIKLIVNKANHELFNTGDAYCPKYIIVESIEAEDRNFHPHDLRIQGGNPPAGG